MSAEGKGVTLNPPVQTIISSINDRSMIISVRPGRWTPQVSIRHSVSDVKKSDVTLPPNKILKSMINDNITMDSHVSHTSF